MNTNDLDPADLNTLGVIGPDTAGASVDTSDHHQHLVKVTVKFPASKHQAYHERFGPAVTIGTVRARAMQHFQVANDDPQYEYYLTADRQRQDDNARLEDLVGDDRTAAFRLVKDLRQG
jgi:hypothetical protein